MSVLPPKPEYGEFQTAEWDEGYGFWRIRDLTPLELLQKNNLPIPEPEPEGTLNLIQYAALKRWNTEIAGITFNGIPLYTDDRSKILIMGARSRAEKNSSIQEQWTAADGVIYTLNASTIIGISDAIGEHVSRCFSKFSEVRGKIDSSEITTYEQIDTEFASINTVYP